MYLVGMDQLTRQDISAAAAAHRELGRDYDDVVAEGLIERIGAEIDKRVDARLGHPAAPAPAPARVTAAPGRSPWAAVVLALGSIGLGIGASAAVMAESVSRGVATTSGASPAADFLVLVIWIVIGVINIAFARRR
jgi:hypothetical protein